MHIHTKAHNILPCINENYGGHTFKNKTRNAKISQFLSTQEMIKAKNVDHYQYKFYQHDQILDLLLVMFQEKV